jgi:hypothetical protein
VSQNSTAAPPMRKDTISMPVMPCVMASLPSGCHQSPESTRQKHADVGYKWSFVIHFFPFIHFFGCKVTQFQFKYLYLRLRKVLLSCRNTLNTLNR